MHIITNLVCWVLRCVLPDASCRTPSAPKVLAESTGAGPGGRADSLVPGVSSAVPLKVHPEWCNQMVFYKLLHNNPSKWLMGDPFHKLPAFVACSFWSNFNRCALYSCAFGRGETAVVFACWLYYPSWFWKVLIIFYFSRFFPIFGMVRWLIGIFQRVWNHQTSENWGSSQFPGSPKLTPLGPTTSNNHGLITFFPVHITTLVILTLVIIRFHFVWIFHLILTKSTSICLAAAQLWFVVVILFVSFMSRMTMNHFEPSIMMKTITHVTSVLGDQPLLLLNHPWPWGWCLNQQSQGYPSRPPMPLVSHVAPVSVWCRQSWARRRSAAWWAEADWHGRHLVMNCGWGWVEPPFLIGW